MSCLSIVLERDLGNCLGRLRRGKLERRGELCELLRKSLVRTVDELPCLPVVVRDAQKKARCAQATLRCFHCQMGRQDRKSPALVGRHRGWQVDLGVVQGDPLRLHLLLGSREPL
jgi:hypothetical protein